MIIFLIMVAYIIGIIMGLYIKNIALFFLIIFIIVLIYLIIIKFNNKIAIFEYIKKSISLKKLFLFFIILIFSFFKMLFLENYYNNTYKNMQEKVNVKAFVVSNIKEGQYKDSYIIKVISIDSDFKYKDTFLQLRISNKKEKLNYGDEIFFEGEYKDAKTARNYGGFDYKNYLKISKIHGLINVIKINKIEKQKYNKFLISINKIKLSIIENVNMILKQDEANLLLGILIGNKDNLNDDIKEAFRDSSLSHMLAVSGTHISYIILTITFLLEKLKTNKKISKIIMINFLIFFSILTGLTSSVARASAMVIYVLVSQIIYKKPSILVSISLSLLIILIINPYRLFDIGLQLSFGGTIGIIILNKIIEEKLNKVKINMTKTNITKINMIKRNKNLNYKQNKKKKISTIFIKVAVYLKNMLIVSLSANIIIFPIIAYHYNTISLTFFISNILAGPILALIIILGFLTLLISFVSIQVSKFFSFFLSALLNLLIIICKFCANLPLSKIYIKTPSIPILILYYFVVIGFLYKKIRVRKVLNKKTIALLLIVVLIFQTISFIPKDLQIYFIDVGQGDSTLILTPKNKAILIDGGDEKQNVLIPYLLDRKITKLDYIIISHFDSDHVGGLLEVIQSLEVKKIVISWQFEYSENYNQFLKIVNSKKINVVFVNKGDRLQIENDLYFDFLWPNQNNVISNNILNNNSIVCKLYYKSFSMLFTADIEDIAEKQIVQEYNSSLNILESTILKVGHHGSKTSSTQELLNSVKPKIALIGVGENNKFGHPNDEVIKRLETIRM